MGARCKETLLHAGIVDRQELVLGCSHVDEIRLTFGTFLVQELVHRLVSGGLEQIGADDLAECQRERSILIKAKISQTSLSVRFLL